MTTSSQQIAAALATWRSLNAILKDLNEDQVKHALDLECMSPVPRKKIVQRLHERYSMLRTTRERAELMVTIFGEVL